MTRMETWLSSQMAMLTAISTTISRQDQAAATVSP